MSDYSDDDVHMYDEEDYDMNDSDDVDNDSGDDNDGDDDDDDEDIQFEEDDDYGFDDDDDDDDDDDNIIENTYYNAKGCLDDDVDEALELFETIPDMEVEKGRWGFKALKQMTKLLIKIGRNDEFIKRYRQLLDYMGAVSRNDSEKAINKTLALLSNANDQKLLDTVYNITLDALITNKNEKLWFNTKIKQGTLYFNAGDFDRLRTVIAELKKYCMLEDGVTEDEKKLSQLLDVYVLEIQMLAELGENKKLKHLYERCTKIASGAVVLNPRMTGVIRECGGKMFMREKQWARAHEDFFEAFKSYDEAGNPRRIQCLQYLVLANMLMSSNINPFEASEAKPYRNHSEIVAMTNLLQAYQQSDIDTFERILRQQRKSITEDSFMKDYIADLLKNIRSKVILRLIRPYTRIRLDFLAKELSISVEEVESLCVELILEQELDGHIDQINALVELNRKQGGGARYKAILDWSTRLSEIHSSVLSKV